MAAVSFFKDHGPETGRFWTEGLQIKRAADGGWRVGRVDGTAEYTVHPGDEICDLFGRDPIPLRELKFAELGVVLDGDTEGVLIHT